MLTLLDWVALSLFGLARTKSCGSWLRTWLDASTPLRVAPAPSLADALAVAAGPDAADGLARDLRAEAEQLLVRAGGEGIAVIPWGDERYPRLLAAIPDPPLVLWIRGDPCVLGEPSVALVGSRAGSPYGLEVAARLAQDLAVAGATVVSGLARGVDSAAHRGALAGDGCTVAVLGSGLLRVYPPEHHALADRVAARGAVVSEWPPDTGPRRLNFRARNRIISGLSLGVVVIEAAERSGSLITASFALQQGREVMAVPGNVLTGRYRGGHALIRDGATVVESAEDVIECLRGSPLRSLARSRPLGPEGPPAGDPLLSALEEGEAEDIDTLAARTGLEPAGLLPRLLQLELQGAVRRVAGGRFVRVGRTC